MAKSYWSEYLKLITIFLIIATMMGCNEAALLKKNKRLITLKNSQIEIGIIPHLGGRIVVLRKPGMNNILKSDSAQWNDPLARPEISAFSDFKAFNGHIVWLSPQSEWWIKQDINLERRDSKAIWPPDPYLIYGNYQITERTDTSLTMVGPASPISGVQLTKKVLINSQGVVTFETSAKNIREQPISWGLWFNTRLDGFARCYLPANESDLRKLAVTGDENETPLPYAFTQGYFTFLPPALSNASSKYVQKAFLIPKENFMVGFSEGQAIKISFEGVPPAQIHPDQAPVEIYNLISASETLLELEVHGPYQTFQPGESIRMAETWQLFKYDGETTPQAHIAFINEKLKGRN